ncbi:helix-turn-helix transcriptional regulator [Cellulomonas sp. NPDC055163]
MSATLTATQRQTLLSETDLAARWQVSRSNLADARSAGRGVPYVKIGFRVRYRLADIEAYEAASLVTPAH